MLQRNVNFEAPNVYAVTSANKFRTLSIDLDIEFLKVSKWTLKYTYAVYLAKSVFISKKNF